MLIWQQHLRNGASELMTLSRAAVALSMATACAFFTPAANAADWTLRFDGIGPLKVGMTFDQAKASLRQRLERTPEDLRPNDHCDEIEVPGHAETALMFIDDKLARVDVWHVGARLHGGVVIGGAERSLMRAYAKASKSPGFYDDSQTEWTLPSADGRMAIRVTTENGAIIAAIAGEAKAVAYVEGCL